MTASRIVAAALAIMAVAIALSIAAVWLLADEVDGGGEAQTTPATAEPPAVPFARPTDGELHRAQIRARMGRYERVDATHLRIPIGVAIDRLAGEPR